MKKSLSSSKFYERKNLRVNDANPRCDRSESKAFVFFSTFSASDHVFFLSVSSSAFARKKGKRDFFFWRLLKKLFLLLQKWQIFQRERKIFPGRSDAFGKHFKLSL